MKLIFVPVSGSLEGLSQWERTDRFPMGNRFDSGVVTLEDDFQFGVSENDIDFVLNEYCDKFPTTVFVGYVKPDDFFDEPYHSYRVVFGKPIGVIKFDEVMAPEFSDEDDWWEKMGKFEDSLPEATKGYHIRGMHWRPEAERKMTELGADIVDYAKRIKAAMVGPRFVNQHKPTDEFEEF